MIHSERAAKTLSVKVLRVALGFAVPLLLVLATTVPHAAAAERAYELVSPVDKAGGEVQLTAISAEATMRAADDGHAVAYATVTPFPGTPSGALRQQYVSTRTPTGWTTRGISPPLAPGPSLLTSRVSILSEEISKAVFLSNLDELTPGDPPFGDLGIYLQDHSTDPPTHVLLNEPADPSLPGSGQTPHFAAATPDLSHILFTANTQLLPEAADVVGLYEWASGELRLAGVLPNGEPVRAIAGARQISDAFDYPGAHPISDDGSRIYFRVGSTGPLYLRQDASETMIVSASEREGDDPQSPTAQAEFLLATADGSTAFFRSPRQLTDDSTASGTGNCNTGVCDLYRWQAEAEAGERLTDLTTQDPDGADVLGDVAADDEAAHVYFVATGVLANGAEQGESNLYLWSEAEDDPRHVATLSDADSAVWSTSLSSQVNRYRDARISEGGQRLLFASRAQLTNYDNDGHRQIYLYDASEDEITCVSCSPQSASSTADASLFEFRPATGNARAPLTLPYNLSSDGSRAFFQTEEPLVPGDTNNRMDVYEWEDGELELVSDGRSTRDAEFLAASADGDDVFFISRARLVGWDQDNGRDVYNAKIGGGFPEPAPSPEPCVGDQCQGPAPVPPGDGAVGSAGFTGPGNEARAGDPRRCMRLQRRAGRAERKARRARGRARQMVRRLRQAPRSTARQRQLRRRAQRQRRRAQRLRGQAKRLDRRARRCVRRLR